MNVYYGCRPALRRAALAIAATGALVYSCHAQQIVLKSGQIAAAKNIRRDGTTLMSTIEIAGRPAEVGYPVIDIDHLDLPKPPQIEKAEQALIVGKPAEALSIIDPVVNMYFPLRDIKGGFWAPAALIRSSAMEGLNKAEDAAALLTLLSGYTIDNRIAFTAKARLAGLLAMGGKAKAAQANTLADSILNSSEDSAVLAEAWLAKGRALYTQEDYEAALLAFLHLPVFYSGSPIATAQALLGSGRSYLAMHDDKRAVRTFLELQEQYATSAEAAAAKKEIEKGGAAMAKLVKEIEAAKAAAEKKLKDAGEKPASAS